MLRFRHRAALLLCLLALWLQLLAPALAVGMQGRTSDPASSICHGVASAYRDGERRAPHPPSCDHCLVCHAMAGALPDAARPAFTSFDYPVSSPSRWAPPIRGPAPLDLRQASRPRGPPTAF